MTGLVVGNDAFAESFLFGHIALTFVGFHYCTNAFPGNGFHIVGLDGFELTINGPIKVFVARRRNFAAFDRGGVLVTRIFNHGSSVAIVGFGLSRLFFVGSGTFTAFGKSFLAAFIVRSIVKGFVAHAVESAEQVILFGATFTTFTTFCRSSFTTFATFVTEVEFTDSVGTIVSRSFTTFITNVEIEGIVATFSADLGTRFGHVEIEVTFRTSFGARRIQTESIVRIGIECRSFRRFSKATRSFRRKFAHTGSGKRIGSRSFAFTALAEIGSHTVRLGFGHILRSQAAIGIAGNLVKEGSQVLRNVVFALDLHHERDEVLFGKRFATIGLQLLGKFINDKSLGFAVHFFLAELREGRHAIRVLVHGHIQDVIRGVVQRFVGSFVVWIEAKTANGFTNGPCILDAEEVRDSFLVHFLRHIVLFLLSSHWG